MQNIKEKTMIIIILLLFISGYGLTRAMGLWHTETTKTPAKILSGEFEGENNPEDIRGSYSFKDIAIQFEIPVDVLKAAFEIPETTDAEVFKSKEIESLYDGVEIGNDAMKAFVSLYKGMSYELEGLILPDSAVDIILNRQPQMTEERVAALNASRLSLLADEDSVKSSAVTEETVKTTTETVQDEPSINGNTTFAQVLALGIPENVVVEIIGADIPSGAMTVKSYCLETGMSFSEVKTKLTELVPE
jgi:hypothetical protein